jgi:DDE domain
LYRAVDSRGQTIDVLLSAKRDAAAAKRFFRKVLGQPHTVNPRTIRVDKNPAYPRAVAEMKEDGELRRRTRLRQVKYFSNIVEQEHRRIKRVVRLELGFGSFWTARGTLAGYEVMAMVRKGQVRRIAGATCGPKRPSSPDCSTPLLDLPPAEAIHGPLQTLQHNPILHALDLKASPTPAALGRILRLLGVQAVSLLERHQLAGAPEVVAPVGPLSASSASQSCASLSSRWICR